MKMVIRVGLLLVLLGMLQLVIQAITQQSGGITRDLRKLF